MIVFVVLKVIMIQEKRKRPVADWMVVYGWSVGHGFRSDCSVFQAKDPLTDEEADK